MRTKREGVQKGSQAAGPKAGPVGRTTTQFAGSPRKPTAESGGCPEGPVALLVSPLLERRGCTSHSGVAEGDVRGHVAVARRPPPLLELEYGHCIKTAPSVARGRRPSRRNRPKTRVPPRHACKAGELSSSVSLFRRWAVARRDGAAEPHCQGCRAGLPRRRGVQVEGRRRKDAARRTGRKISGDSAHV